MLTRLRAFFGALLRRRRMESEMDAELRFHMEAYADDLARAGVPRAEAERRAGIEFGGVARTKEDCRQSLGLRLVDELRQDLRYAARSLRKTPGFAAAAVFTLALGIGANTAVFSVVNAVILRPLRFPQSDRLMTVLDSDGKKGYPPMEHIFYRWRDGAGAAFEKMAGAVAQSLVVTVRGEPREVRAVWASAEIFDLMGARPLVGRLFSAEETQPGHDQVVLLDEGFWRREFGGDPHVIGQSMIFGELQRTIVGILPAGIRFADFGARDVWMPLVRRPNGEYGGVVVVGRLCPGVTPAGAQAVVNAVMAQSPYRRSGKLPTAFVKPLREWMVGDVRSTFLTLMGAAAFILLIACANVANLLLARAAARQREMALRAALGAGRWRLARQALVESVLLGTMGGAAGTVLAFAATRAVPAIKAIEIPRGEEVGVDGAVLLAAAAVSILSGILFGLAPALQPWRGGLIARLRAGEGAGISRSSQRLRSALAVAQLALALVLLSGAGLMTNTLLRLVNVDLGFGRAHVVTVETRSAAYTRQSSAVLTRSLAEDIRRMPGVLEASASGTVPLQKVLYPYRLTWEAGGQSRECEAHARPVDPRYIRALGIPLLAGRDLELADDARTPVPALLNKTAAQALFGIENPVGAVVRAAGGGFGAIQVVGVVGDIRMFGVAIAPPPQLYLPLVRGYAYSVVVRTEPDTGDLSAAIRAAARRIDPKAPPPKIETMDARFSDEIAKPRFYFLLLGAFAGIGLALAGIGIYGVMAYSVARRTHEFGVRMALGAERADILRLVFGSGMKMACAGAALGFAGAVAANRLLASLLYGVKPGDPVTLICVTAVLVGVAFTACYLAGRRATAVDPNVALRCE
jgi:putative ABC transport system permease protein